MATKRGFSVQIKPVPGSSELVNGGAYSVYVFADDGTQLMVSRGYFDRANAEELATQLFGGRHEVKLTVYDADHTIASVSVI
ncbi:MAG: hypothetical protein JOY78_20270 [Pseudonocardia sp.]|nr:hypothetical protein [Pseudonocardia sp.]